MSVGGDEDEISSVSDGWGEVGGGASFSFIDGSELEIDMLSLEICKVVVDWFEVEVVFC